MRIKNREKIRTIVGPQEEIVDADLKKKEKDYLDSNVSKVQQPPTPMAPSASTSRPEVQLLSNTSSDLLGQGSSDDIEYLSPSEVNLIKAKVKSNRNLASSLAEKIFTDEEISPPLRFVVTGKS